MTVIKIKAQIQPTEDPEKVIKALTNLFGNIQLNHDLEENMITGKDRGDYAAKRTQKQDRPRPNKDHAK